VRKILIDVNVVLDLLLDRKPFVEASAAVWAAIETGTAEGVLAAHAVTTVYYLVQKEMGGVKARRIIAEILRIFDVAAVDLAVVQAGCDFIGTRDLKRFRGSPVRSLTPEAVAPLLST
jgi:predicted nucleic acid-binding protein